jgi:hypothetical protein
MDASDFERRVVASSTGGDGPELAGPFVVLDTTEGMEGGSIVRVSASSLVPIEADDPDLAGLSIAVPVTAAVELDPQGEVVGIDVPTDPEAERQAQAFTRNLIARGEVRGLPGAGPVRRGPRPPTRTTHEVTVDELGRRVIRRTGFTSSTDRDIP